MTTFCTNNCEEGSKTNILFRGRLEHFSDSGQNEEEEKKLFQIGRNGKKIEQKLFSDFFKSPLPRIRNWPKMKKYNSFQIGRNLRKNGCNKLVPN